MSTSTNTRLPIVLVALLVVLGWLLAATPVSAAPTSWDWRDVGGVNCVSGVRNQKSCGSCYILMPVELVESREMIQAMRVGRILEDLNYSEQYVMACGSGYYGEFDCGGGWPKDTLTFIQQVGIPVDECYRYTGADADCPTECPDSGGEIVLHQIPGPVNAYSGYPDQEWLKQELYENGPIAVGMGIYQDFFAYSSGIYQHVSGAYAGLKTMLIVGYGTESGTPYWIVKNSWGPGWGENGFFRILRGGGDNCEFAEWAYTATVGLPATAVEDTPPPLVTRPLWIQPNPFNPRTTISFVVPTRGPVSLCVYDLAGRLVRTLVDEELNAAMDHSVLWDGRDEHGTRVTSGVYFARVRTAGVEATQKMALIR